MLARTPVPTPAAPPAPQQEITTAYLTAAYRMCAIRGILNNETADHLFTAITTQGRDTQNRLQPIVDPALLRTCIDQASCSYALPHSARSCGLSRPLALSTCPVA